MELVSITASKYEAPHDKLVLPPYHPPICAVQSAFKVVMVAQWEDRGRSKQNRIEKTMWPSNYTC